MKMFRLFPGTHQEVFVHLGVLRTYFVSLLISEVGNDPRVHLDSPLDRSLLLKVLDIP